MDGPVLRVLGAVLCAHRDAQHQRHLQQPTRHRLPLGHLVEDFVAGAAHEVAVHQLGDDTAAAHGIARAGTDDRTFGNRRVEQPVVGQRLGQAAVDAKRAAPIAVLLAKRHHGRVLVEAVDHRLKERLGIGQMS